MTRTDILIRFIKKSIVPIITAILLYNLFAGLCIANGNLNYMYLLMLCEYGLCSHCRSLSAIRAPAFL